MVLSSSKTIIRFKRKKSGRCLCGLIDIKTGVLLVSFLALLTDACICFISIFPRYADGNFETINVAKTSLLNPRVAGIIFAGFGMITSFLLFIGNRFNEHYFYVLFMAFVIIYDYYATFVLLFQALLLTEEKGDMKASKRYLEAFIQIVSSLLNLYYASVVASG